MTRVNKYDTYKDSGIEWIGEIPQEWEITHIKNYCKTVFSGGTPDTTKFEYWDGDISWLPSGEIQNCIIDTPVRYITNEGLENSSTKMIPANTTLIAMTGATCGNVGYLTFDSCANQSVTAYIANGTTYSKFLYYLLRGAKEEILLNKTGGAQGGINVFNCKNIPVPYLSYAEQKRIADYLDEKCGEIDRIVETEKAVIEKLKEYKQSIITEAVTKGLDKAVPLKDSGIEWIGKIPQHWNVTQISKLYEVILGKMLCTNPSTGTDTLENYLCSANIKFDGVKTDEIKQMYFNKNEKDMYLLNENDIVISEGGDAGTASIYKGEAQPCYIQNAVHKVCTFDIDKMLNKFLYYWIFLCKKCGYIDLICNKATIMHYTKEKVSKTPIVFLPIEEQQQIIEYLDKKCSEIDKAIADKEQLIEKFTEYKKSLIYECATGKRKVIE